MDLKEEMEEKVLCRIAWIHKNKEKKSSGSGSWLPYDTHYEFLLKFMKDQVRMNPDLYYYVEYSTIIVYKEHKSRWNFRCIMSECSM